MLVTWAQVRTGAAMASLTLDQMLSQPRLAASGQAAVLRQQISDFLSAPAVC